MPIVQARAGECRTVVRLAASGRPPVPSNEFAQAARGGVRAWRERPSRRPGVRPRRAVGLPWACLLLLAGTFSLPAQAQTDVTLVSNTGETVAATGADLGGAPADDKQYAAIRFETGSNDRGYTLSSVQAAFSGLQTGDVPTVRKMA